MTQTTTITRTQRRAILRSADQTQTNIRIEVVPGVALAPRTIGRGWNYTTRTGRPILYPTAYAGKGWSSMVYHRSTRRVQVGEQWLAQA